jgi:hypothetical protein
MYIINEDFYLLGFNVVNSDENQLAFWRNTSLPPSGSKSEPRMKPARIRQHPLNHIRFLLGLSFFPEGRGDILLQRSRLTFTAQRYIPETELFKSVSDY